MGQQQLLFIVLGVIVVGLAIIAGLNLFRANAIESKTNNIINECVNLAAMAQKYYLTPSMLGGGNRSFEGWKIPSNLLVTGNGSFAITDNSNPTELLEITGTSNEVVNDQDSIRVTIRVFPTTYEVSTVN